MTDLCGEAYRRPTGQTLTCQYLTDHPAVNHSWWAVSVQDRHDDAASIDVDALLAGMVAGWFDPYLEAILAAGHARKRELRGVRHPYGLTTETYGVR